MSQISDRKQEVTQELQALAVEYNKAIDTVNSCKTKILGLQGALNELNNLEESTEETTNTEES
jgi:chaperonin cofactor prefoldin